MKNLIATFVTTMFSILVFAQNEVNINVKKVNTSIFLESNKNYVLLLNEPKNGSVIFKDNTIGKSKLNFNLLTDDLLFVDSTKTYRSVNNQTNIKYVSIGKDLFYNTQKGFIQVIANINNVKLAIARKFKPVNISSKGAYGLSNNTASTTQLSRIANSDNNNFSMLSIEQKVNLGYHELFYLIDNDKFFLINSVKPFVKVFKVNKKEVENFSKINNIDFNKREDILKLMNFCTSYLNKD